MPSTNIDRARSDILEMFGPDYWAISFTTDGLRALNGLVDQSLGRYFEDIEDLPGNQGRDLWADPKLKEMPQFILGYVVAQIAIALKNVSPTDSVDAITINVIGKSVMRDGKTEQNCAFMLASYHKKVAHRGATPICDGVRAKGVWSTAKSVEEKPAERRPAEREPAKAQQPEEKRPQS